MYSGGGPDIGGAIRLLFVLAAVGSLGTLIGLGFGVAWLLQHVSLSFH
jgi:hypothetical protein